MELDLQQAQSVTPQMITTMTILQYGAQEPILNLSQMEEQHIRSTLAAVGQNYSEAARLLGISRSTLYGKVKKYGIA
jgi:transcriptional regulator of acetoin/glycerol metabolism